VTAVTQVTAVQSLGAYFKYSLPLDEDRTRILVNWARQQT
jgi:hypothetical protein